MQEKRLDKFTNNLKKEGYSYILVTVKDSDGKYNEFGFAVNAEPNEIRKMFYQLFNQNQRFAEYAADALDELIDEDEE